MAKHSHKARPAADAATDRLRRAIVPTLICIYAVLRLPPWLPRVVGTSLDASWRWAFHEVWRLGLQHGTEFVFSSGPWGFVITETYHPATYGLMLGIYLGASLVLALALWGILRLEIRRPWMTLIAAVVFIEAIGLWDVSQTLFFHLGLALLAGRWLQTARAEPFRPARLEAALVVAMALASQMKFTYFVFALVCLAVAAADELRRRRFPWLVVTYGGSWLIFWILAGQSISGIPEYLRQAVEIAGGFNAAMGVRGPVPEVVLYAVAAVLLVGFWSLASRERGRPWSWLPAGGLAVLLFLLFKVAFVRHDGHALTPAPLLVPWSLVCLAPAWSRFGTVLQKLLAVSSVAAALVFAGTVVGHYRDLSLPRLTIQNLGGWPARLAAAGGTVLGSDRWARRHEEAAARIRERLPLSNISGTVDLYPVSTAYVLAHGLDYRPRPVHHSYSAYTPRLAAMNAQHLRGPAAPETILFEVAPIDGRFPALDDGPSWPELLTRYEPVAAVGRRFLRLDRATQPRRFSLEALTDREVHLGQRVALDGIAAGEPIWAKVELRPTRIGRLQSILYKSPTVTLSIETANGVRRTYRFLPALAAAGFLISPKIDRVDDFAKLMQPDATRLLARQRVVAITIEGANETRIDRAYRSSYRLQLWRLDLGHRRAGRRE